jgi:FkbM family methyltransferase
MVFVDIGANIGIHTLQAARAVGATGMVYSFEPDPKTFGILQQNVRANGFHRVELYPLAVLDRKGELPLYRVEGLSTWNNIFGGKDAASSVLVESAALDEALQHVPRIDVIKIDAEGAEPAILRGMEKILARNPGVRLLLEYAPQHLHRAGVSPAQFLEGLFGQGFLIEEIDELSGEVAAADRGRLVSAYSANLSLRHGGEIVSAAAEEHGEQAADPELSSIR